jgi:hypothetical protein
LNEGGHVRYRHLASFRCRAKFGRYWTRADIGRDWR